jgi:hypothetical protein
VNSKRGSQFRQWATGILRNRLTHGWTLDRARMVRNAAELAAALALVRKTAQAPELSADAGRGLVEIVSRYTQTFLLLQRYCRPKRPNGAVHCVTNCCENAANCAAAGAVVA